MSELRPYPHTTISSVLARPSTRYVVFSTPYQFLAEGDAKDELKFLSYADVGQFMDIGDPHLANSGKQWIFLGCDPSDVVDDHDPASTDYRLAGRGYLAIDLGPPAGKDTPSTPAQSLLASLTSKGASIVPLRPFAFHLPSAQASILGTAAHLMDWHSRTKFCAGCGRPNLSVDAGWKRSCAPVPSGPKCPAHAGIQNYSFPRFDPVAIACVAHPDGDRLFLGRNKGWPEKYYSSMAGFMEPGEGIFDAVRREIKEETGLELDKVVFHSAQPWCFPGSLMIGCVGLAKEGSERFEPEEAELQDGRWFTRSEVLLSLFLSSTQDWGSPVPPNVLEKAPFLTGPGYAISSQLVKSWATGEMDQILFGRKVLRRTMEEVLKEAGIWDWVAKAEGLPAKI
ncbi:NUDIX hydrolase domain-like protein [Hyaloraphidium curvatum]|nr:NUDIX hydrolase domain-like protein [Hyaloraphidium curvatum]